MAAANDQTKGHVMTSSNQKKFLVLYLVPASVMEEGEKADPNDRKVAEEKMRGEWGNWMSTHSKMIIATDAGGRPNVSRQVVFPIPRTISSCARS